MRLVLFLVAFLILFFLYYTNFIKTNEVELIQGDLKTTLSPIDYAKKTLGQKAAGSDETERKVKEAMKK